MPDEFTNVSETWPTEAEVLVLEAETLAVEAPLEREAESKRLRWFEVSLVLLVACGGYILSSLFILNNAPVRSPVAQNARWTMGILQEVTALLLLGYVLSRRRMRIRDLGLRWSFREVGYGLVVTIAAYLAYAVGYSIVRSIHHALFPGAPSSATVQQLFGHVSFMAIPLFLLNPFFEELIVRAYLMTEVKDLTGSWTWSIVISTVVQFSYHLYYGWVGALSLSFQFLIFSIYYARTRRATPIVVAHGIFDVLGLVRLW
jgi:membrane protease YdiL (CAAX protease family)